MRSSFLLGRAGRIGFDFELQLPGGELVQRGVGVVWIGAGRAHDALALKAELTRSVDRKQILVATAFRLKIELPIEDLDFFARRYVGAAGHVQPFRQDSR